MNRLQSSTNVASEVGNHVCKTHASVSFASLMFKVAVVCVRDQLLASVVVKGNYSWHFDFATLSSMLTAVRNEIVAY